MSLSSVSSSLRPIIPSFKTVQEIPSYCTRLAELLDRQPLFQGTYPSAAKWKFLPMKYGADVHVFHYANQLARTILGNSDWPLYRIGERSNMRDRNGALVEGVALWVEDQPRCSIKELERAYKSSVKRMQICWIETKIEDHPQLPSYDKNRRDFSLFIKPGIRGAELPLLWSIASKFNISDDIDSGNMLHSFSGNLRATGYLWVRKSAFSDIREKLGIQFERKF